MCTWFTLQITPHSPQRVRARQPNIAFNSEPNNASSQSQTEEEKRAARLFTAIRTMKSFNLFPHVHVYVNLFFLLHHLLCYPLLSWSKEAGNRWCMLLWVKLIHWFLTEKTKRAKSSVLIPQCTPLHTFMNWHALSDESSSCFNLIR